MAPWPHNGVSSVGFENWGTGMEQGSGSTATLAHWVSTTRCNDIPPAVVHEAKRMIIDSIGVAIGARLLDCASITIELATEMGGPEEATILGGNRQVGAAAAAFANSYLGNALDADETLYNRGHHAVATVFPALALAERNHSPGTDLLAAVALGYDIGARVGTSMTWQQVELNGRTVSTTSLGWISFAAAAAAASVVRLDPLQTEHALGIAGWTSPLPFGLQWQQITTPKPMLKYVPYGFAAQQGVLATQLAGKGFTGNLGVLDGDTGYWRVTGAAACDWELLTGNLGRRWWIQEASYKPYASGRYCNFGIDLFRKILSDHRLRPDEIDKVEVWTIAHAAVSWFNNVPESQIDMVFNIPIAFAACAHGSDLGPQWQSWASVRDPRLPAFAAKVDVRANTELVDATGAAPVLPALGQLPTRVPTKVAVHARGHVFAEATDFGWGDPWTDESRMTDHDIRDKFRRFTSGVLRSSRIEEVLDVLFELDGSADITRDLSPLLR